MATRPWTYNDLARPPIVWQEAADIAAQAKAGPWVNRGAQGGTATQPNDTWNPPVDPNGAGQGVPAIMLGGSQILELPIVLKGKVVSVFAIAAFTSPGNGGKRLISLNAHDADYNDDRYAAVIKSTGYSVPSAELERNGGTVTGGIGIADLCLINNGFDGTNAYVEVDGIRDATGTDSRTFDATFATIGGWYLFGSSPVDNWTGPLVTYLIFDYTPTGDDRDRIIATALWNAKRQARIPAGNPYRDAAPTVSDGTGGSTYAISGTGRTEYAAQIRLTRYGRISTAGGAEFAASSRVRSYMKLPASGAFELSGRSQVKGRQDLRLVPARIEQAGSTKLGVLGKIVTRAADEFAGRTALAKLKFFATSAVTEFLARTGLAQTAKIGSTGRTEFVGSANPTVQPQLNFNSVYGNPGAPYGYGPYGRSPLGVVQAAGGLEFIASAVVGLIQGYQPADFYAVTEYPARVVLGVDVPLHAQRASLAFSGAVTATVLTQLRSAARIEMAARGRVTTIMGFTPARGGHDMAGRIRMSYGWSDLSYPTRPVVGSWGNAAPVADPWQTVQTGGDGWQTARPVPEK